MDTDSYSMLLGSLVGNFHSLEFVLRAYLTKLPTHGPLGIPTDRQYYEYPPGSEVGIDAFSNYDSLGDLIDKVNAHLSTLNLATIDRNLVELRNAFAHGRISAPNKSANLHLIKFDNPDKSGRVRVVFNQELTEDWLAQQKRNVCDALQYILAHMPA